MQVRSRQPFIMIIVIITIMIKIIMIMIVIMIIMIVLTLTNDPDDDDESYPDADRCRKRVKGLRECIAEQICNQLWPMSSLSLASLSSLLLLLSSS